MNDWFTEHKKAIAGFVSALLSIIAAVLAANILPEDVANNVAAALIALTPVFTLLGVTWSPPNKPAAVKPPQEV